MDDDAESIITNERYVYIASIIKSCYKKHSKGLTVSDKIDKVVTNRWLALPIFVLVMFVFVYFVSVTTVGTWATDWANDGVFGMAGICWELAIVLMQQMQTNSRSIAGSKWFYRLCRREQGIDTEAVTAALDTESEDFDPAVAKTELAEFASQFSTDEASYTVTDEETLATEDVTSSGEELTAALGVYEQYNYTERTLLITAFGYLEFLYWWKMG